MLLFFEIIGGSQGLSPEAQVVFIVCFLIAALYTITLVAFYPGAARRITNLFKIWQPQQGNKRIGGKRREGGK